MAVDLRAWQRQAAELTDSTEAAQQLFWRSVEQEAKTDVLCYGLWVHGQEHRVLRQLAMSRHAYVWATAMEQSPRTLFVTAPEHGKTTILRWKMEQHLGLQTERAFAAASSGDGEQDVKAPAVLLIMNSEKQATRPSMTISAALSTPRYRALYPRVAPDIKWGEAKEQWYLKRPSTRADPSFLAAGLEQSSWQGLRFTMIVVDDPTGQTDARSEATLEAHRAIHQGMLLDRCEEDGVIYEASTRWSKRDIPEMLLGNSAWSCSVMPCYDYWRKYPEHDWMWEGGEAPKALWPEAWPEARLEKRRLEKSMASNSKLWMLSYLCSPTLAEGQMFRRDWLGYRTVPPTEAPPSLMLAEARQHA